MLDIAVSHALLLQVAKRDLEPVARLYCPRPTLAFGRLDQGSPHFSAALGQALNHGFDPVVRLAGGRAAAYHLGSLIFETVLAENESYRRIDERYREVSSLLCGALSDLGADVAVGELAGEYCAGRFSLNVGGRIKVAGTAQRVVPGASLTSTAIIISAGEAVREVMVDVSRALELDFDPGTTGALEDVLPHVGLTDVERALAAQLGQRGRIAPGSIEPATLQMAHRLLPRHASRMVCGTTDGRQT